MQNFDLFVIGAGSGGVRAARMAANRGAKVAIAEVGKLGGTCVNVGCIPKKLYSYAAHYSADFVDSRGFGWDVEAPSFTWSKLRDNKREEITRLNGIYNNLLQNAGVTLLAGRAEIVSRNSVKVGAETFGAKHILVCTGGRPQLPDFQGNELAVTSDQIFDLDTFPNRILILGAGYIGVEFAAIFSGLGARVSLSWRGDMPLRGFDEDLRKHFMKEAGKHSQLLPGTRIRALRRAGGNLVATFEDGKELEVDAVLAATGRVPNSGGLGLENTDVTRAEDGSVEVNERFQTAEPTIYAIGDVVGRKALTPVALAEAMIVVDYLFGEGKRSLLSYVNIPTAVFSHPNLATVGLTETRAREKYSEVAVYETDFRALRHTLSGRDERTYMKVLVDPGSDRVLGMHMMGADAGEIIQGFAAAMTCGLTKAQLDATIGIHPTAAEEFVTMRMRAR